MQQDLAGLQDDSLDHISRRMDDVRRRLAQGRSGQRVQDIENGVVASLDKLIKQVEDQMQQQQSRIEQFALRRTTGSTADAGQPAGSDEGAGRSRASRHRAQARVGAICRRRIAKRRCRTSAANIPSHYREVIEEYFRRLAAEESAEKP